MTVSVDYALWFAICEVTLADYISIVGCPPSRWTGYVHLNHLSPPAEPLPPPELCPAAGVAWPEATRFAELLTRREHTAGRIPEGLVFRLPTEREWEFTAAASSETHFFFGDDPGMLWRYGNYADAENHGPTRLATDLRERRRAWRRNAVDNTRVPAKLHQ